MRTDAFGLMSSSSGWTLLRRRRVEVRLLTSGSASESSESFSISSSGDADSRRVICGAGWEDASDRNEGGSASEVIVNPRRRTTGRPSAFELRLELGTVEAVAAGGAGGGWGTDPYTAPSGWYVSSGTDKGGARAG